MVNKILRLYEETKSIRMTAKECECSWQRVVKILSSEGVVINDTHKKILQMRDEGFDVSQIADSLNLNRKTVSSYLPSVRPYYGINQSKNAKRIERHRKKQAQMK